MANVNYDYRMKLIMKMDEMLRTIGDEDLLDLWFLAVGDDLDDENIVDIVQEDEIYENAQKVFKRCIKCMEVG